MLDRRAALMTVRIAEKSATSTPMRAKMEGFDQDMASLSCFIPEEICCKGSEEVRKKHCCVCLRKVYRETQQFLENEGRMRRKRLQSAVISGPSSVTTRPGGELLHCAIRDNTLRRPIPEFWQLRGSGRLPCPTRDSCA